VAGMMASILGVEEYFDDEAFSTFSYSVVVLNPIIKKSFSQNYINDYTSKVQTHINSLKKSDFSKVSTGLRDKKSPQKPINRELLLNPKYLIVIKEFKYEKQIISYMNDRISKFPFYLGNSEFSGNFRLIELKNVHKEILKTAKLDSFILEEDLKQVDFKEGVRYSTISFATKLSKSRTPIESTSVIVGSEPITMKEASVDIITTQLGKYHCRFI